MKRIATILAATAWLAGCATTGVGGAGAEAGGPKEKSDPLFDTGRPQTAAQKAYDVDWYELRTEVFPETKSISGSSTMRFTAVAPLAEVELDFDPVYDIASIRAGGDDLDYDQVGPKLYVTLARPLAAGETGSFTVTYAGTPHEATRPPWEGGFTWETTEDGRPWIATSFQGEGCDIWWPCKDHPLGEPREGADLYFTVPAGLTAVANGTLQNAERLEDGRTTFHWRTEYSTNLYGISLNAGPYTLIETTAKSVNGRDVAIKFWALEENTSKAQDLFDREFEDTFHWFERTVGPFPWGEEKLGVVETPHLGMEHQTVNAYGNEYKRGDYGFDWLFHHELAHEWFGNLMSVRNNADMWLHEGGANYVDTLRVKEVMGDAAYHAARYQSYLGIRACAPMAMEGERSEDEVYYHDNGGPGGDIYAKGSWVLHSLRYAIGEDDFDRSLRRLLYGVADPYAMEPPYEPRFRTTDDFLAIVNDETGRSMDWFFDVYARRGPLPVLATKEDGGDLVFSWENTGDVFFPMPVPVRVNGEMRRLDMSSGSYRLRGGAGMDVDVDPYMQILRKLPSVPTCEEREAEEEAAKAEKEKAES